MADLVADTHAAIWYLLLTQDISLTAMKAMDQAIANGESIYVSAISVVEVVYLIEKRRLPEIALLRLEDAILNPSSGFIIAPVDLAIATAVRGIPRSQVPDLPDRIIAATALHLGLPLVSRDQKIRASAIHTIW